MEETMINGVVERIKRGGSATLTCGLGVLSGSVRKGLQEIEQRLGDLKIETKITVSRHVQKTTEPLDVPWDGVHRPMPGQTFSVAPGVDPKSVETLPLHPDDPRAAAEWHDHRVASLLCVHD